MLQSLILKSEQEQIENNKKLLSNIGKKINDIESFNNEHFLNLISHVYSLIN